MEDELMDLLACWGQLSADLQELKEKTRVVADAMRVVEMNISGMASSKGVRDLSHNGVRVRKVTTLEAIPERLAEVNPSLVRVKQSVYVDKTALREFWNRGEDERSALQDIAYESTTYVIDKDERKGRALNG